MKKKYDLDAAAEAYRLVRIDCLRFEEARALFNRNHKPALNANQFTGLVFRHEKLLADKETSKAVVCQDRAKHEMTRTAALRRVLSSTANEEPEILVGMEKLVKKIQRIKVKPKAKSAGKRSMTIEVLISDLHIGLKTKKFNYSEAIKRMTIVVNEVKGEIEREGLTYSIDKLLIPILGDIINSSTMHGHSSAIESEFTNSEQVVKAVELLYAYLISPLAVLGIPIVIPCITGNHDRSETAKLLVNPGYHNLSWIAYRLLEILCNASGFTNVSFQITEQAFHHTKIYNNVVFYEHGDTLGSLNRVSMDKLIQRRQTQIGSLIDFYRIGHYHEYTVFGQGRIVVNGSLCGETGFANTLGLFSCAGQTINLYVETKNRPTCFFKSYPVYLGE